MRTTIDKAGRIVLPKHLRDQFDLYPGAELEIRSCDGSISLIPTNLEPHLAVEEGICVYNGRATGNLLTAIERGREARLSEAGGAGLST